MTATLIDELWPVVERHGQVVAADDNDAVLADFMPDRIGQLVAAADVPAGLRGSRVRSLEERPDGSADAIITYTTRDGVDFDLRSHWVRYDGGWRVNSVRNLPATPPRMTAEGPGDDGLDKGHWAGLKAGELRIQQCRSCSSWIWSPRPICPQCHSFDLGWTAVEPIGRVYSWTRTWQPFARESTGHLPYVVALVELPHADNKRLLGVLAGVDRETIRIGATVRGRIDQPDDDDGWPLIRWHVESESEPKAGQANG